MNSKTSLFNRHIIKTDIKRFWWVAVLLFVFTALFILPNAVYRGLDYSSSFIYSCDDGLFSFCAAFFLSGMLFSYLHKGNAVSTLHGIPVSRTSHILSHYVSGALIIGIPIIISSVIIGIECIYYGAELKFAFQYFYISAIYAATVFSVVAFSSLISGNTIAAYIFSFCFMILPAFLISTIDAIFSRNLYGYYSIDAMSEVLSYIYLVGFNWVWSFRSIIYIVGDIILLALNILIYKKRKLESYDEIVAISRLKPVFMYTLAICCGLFGYIMADSIFGIESIFLGVLPLGIIALIAAHMLNNKSFSLKGALKPVIIFAACMGIVNIIFAYDLTGYEHRVPNIDDIESVEPYRFYYGNALESAKDGVSYDDISYKGELTFEEDIKFITDFHRAIIENNDNKPESKYSINKQATDIKIKYNLKNGSTLQRSYYIYNEDFENYIDAYYENGAYKKIRYPILNDNEKQLKYVRYEGINTKESIILENINMDKLYDAFERDIMSMSCVQLTNTNAYNIGMTLIIGYDEIIDYNGKELRFDCEQEIYLNNYFVNTLAVINDSLKAYSDNIIDVSNINDFIINDNDIENKEDIQNILTDIMNIDFGEKYYTQSETVDISVIINGQYKDIYVPESLVGDTLSKYVAVDEENVVDRQIYN